MSPDEVDIVLSDAGPSGDFINVPGHRIHKGESFFPTPVLISEAQPWEMERIESTLLHGSPIQKIDILAQENHDKSEKCRFPMTINLAGSGACVVLCLQSLYQHQEKVREKELHENEIDLLGVVYFAGAVLLCSAGAFFGRKMKYFADTAADIRQKSDQLHAVWKHEFDKRTEKLKPKLF